MRPGRGPQPFERRHRLGPGSRRLQRGCGRQHDRASGEPFGHSIASRATPRRGRANGEGRDPDHHSSPDHHGRRCHSRRAGAGGNRSPRRARASSRPRTTGEAPQAFTGARGGGRSQPRPRPSRRSGLHSLRGGGRAARAHPAGGPAGAQVQRQVRCIRDRLPVAIVQARRGGGWIRPPFDAAALRGRPSQGRSADRGGSHRAPPDVAPDHGGAAHHHGPAGPGARARSVEPLTVASTVR